MSHWRDNLEEVICYKPDHSSRWQTIELCYDKSENSYCLVTEIMASNGAIRHVSDEFATAFVAEFGSVI
jgi:hypothetical protein